MKKVLCIAAIAFAGIIVFTSCGKRCYCTRYEDGSKIKVEEYEYGARYFNKNACTIYSQATHRGSSIVVEDKEVDVEIRCK